MASKKIRKVAKLSPGRFHIKYDFASSSQEELAKEIAAGARVVLYCGGIRSGKTHSAIAEAIKQVYVYGSLPNLGWIISPTYPMSLVPERKFKELCTTDSGSLIAHYRASERSYLLRPCKALPNRYYRVEVKTADNPDHLRGSSIAWAVLDEAAYMKPEVFQIMLGRVLDSKGLLILCTTPRGKNWIYSDVYLPSLNNPRWKSIKARTVDNKYLDPHEIEDLYARYSSKNDDFAKQELEAEFRSFEGMVFKEFDFTKHVVPTKKLPDNVDVVCGIDWGYNDPFCCVWLAKLDGCWVVVDEYYKTQRLLRDHAAYLLNHPLARNVRRYWCDPSSLQNRKEMQSYGIPNMAPARRPDKSRLMDWPTMRARLVNTLFSRRVASPWSAPDKPEQIPGLVFFDGIRHGVREVQGLCFENTVSVAKDSQTGAVVGFTVFDKEGKQKDSNAKEKLVDKDNHFVDALGYALFSEVKWFPETAAYYEEDGKLIKQLDKTFEEKLDEEVEEKLEDIMRRKMLNKIEKFDTFDMQGLG